MLTIDQLRAMPPADRRGYLTIEHNQIAADERDATRAQRDAEEHDRNAVECRKYAGHVSARAREARAYFAILEAAGLWPRPTPTEGR